MYRAIDGQQSGVWSLTSNVSIKGDRNSHHRTNPLFTTITFSQESASAAFEYFYAGAWTKKMQSPGPISLLAKYLRDVANTGSGEPHPIRIPQLIHAALKDRLQNAPPSHEAFEKAEIEDLVDSLGDNLERWSLLDESSFAAIAMAFIFTEKCMAREEGVFRLYIALQSMENGLGNSRRTAYKNIVGEKLMQTLITFFLDNRRQALARRWAGLLLVELLETEENRNILQTICDGEGKTYLLQIGKIVVEGRYRIPKHICGSLISELAINATISDRQELLLAIMPKDAFDIKPFDDSDHFPIGTGAQWELNFTNYLLDLEIAREQKNLRIPMCFAAISVKINDTYIGMIGNVICDMSDILTLRIPTDSELSHHRWVDIDLANIQAVVMAPLDSDTTILSLCLCDYKEMDYLFLLDMKPVKDPDTIIIHVRTDEAELIRNDLMAAKVYRREKWNKKAGKQNLARSWLVAGDAPPTYSIPAGYKIQQEDHDVRQRREDLEKDVVSPPVAGMVTPVFSQDRGDTLQDLLEVMAEQHSHSHLNVSHINVQHSATQSQEMIQPEQLGLLQGTQSIPDLVQSYRSVSMASETQEKDMSLNEPVANATPCQEESKLSKPEERTQTVSKENLSSKEVMSSGKHVKQKVEPSRIQLESKRITNQPNMTLKSPDKPNTKPKPRTPAFKPLTLKTYPSSKSKIQKKGNNKPNESNSDSPSHLAEIVIKKDIYDFASDDEPIKEPSKTTGKRKAAPRGNKKVPGSRKKPKTTPKPKPNAASKGKKKTEPKSAERVIDDGDGDAGPPPPPPAPVSAPKLLRTAPVKSKVITKPAAQAEGGPENEDARPVPMAAQKVPMKVGPAVVKGEPGDDDKMPPPTSKKKVIRMTGAGADVSNHKPIAASKRTTLSKPAPKGKGKPVVPKKRPASPEDSDNNVQPPQKVLALRRSARFKDAPRKNFKIESDFESDSEIEDSQSSLPVPSPKAPTKNREKDVAKLQQKPPSGEDISNISSLVPQLIAGALAHTVSVKEQKGGVAKAKPASPPPEQEDSPISKASTLPSALKASVPRVTSEPGPGEKQEPSAGKMQPDYSIQDTHNDAPAQIHSTDSEPQSSVSERKLIARKTQPGSIIQKAITMAERDFAPTSTSNLPPVTAEIDNENGSYLPETNFIVYPDLTNIMVSEMEHATENPAASKVTSLQKEVVEGSVDFHEPLIHPEQDIKAAAEASNSYKTTEKEAQVVVPVGAITSGLEAEKTVIDPKSGIIREANTIDAGTVMSESLSNGKEKPTATAEMSTEPITTAIALTESEMVSSPEVIKLMMELPFRNTEHSGEMATKKHVAKTDKGNRSGDQSGAKAQETELNNPKTPTTRASHVVSPSASNFTNPYQPIDENLARKPQIIKWGIDGPKNQGRLVPKTPVHQRLQQPQAGAQAEQSDDLSFVGVEDYQPPDAPSVNEVSVKPFAENLYTPLPQPPPGKQPEEETKYARETDLERKIHVPPPGSENNEELYSKLESTHSEPAEEVENPSDDEDLYSKPESLQSQGEELEGISPVLTPKQPIRSTFIIAGDDEDYFFGNIPQKDSLSKDIVDGKLIGSQVRSLPLVRRRTVESTGSPLPKLLSSQKDMEEANRLETKVLKPSLLPFAFIKQERSPSSSSSVGQSPDPEKLPSRVGNSIETAIVLEESSPEPPEETPSPARSDTPLVKNVILTPARTVITSDIHTSYKITPSALNTVSSRKPTPRKVRFNEMPGLPVGITPGFGPKLVPEHAQDTQNLQSTIGSEAARAKGQAPELLIKRATAKVVEKKCSIKTNSNHAQNQLEPCSKEEHVTSKRSTGRNMSDELWEILNSSQGHLPQLQKQKLKAHQSARESGTLEDKQNTHGISINSSATGRFFKSVKMNGIFNPAKEQKREPSKKEDRGNPDDPNKTLADGGGHESDHADDSSDEDSDPSDDDDDSSDDHTSDSGGEGNIYQDDWRSSLPDYHKETLSVLEKITKHWIYYLMSSEERIEQTLKDYETRADEVIALFQETHFDEYCQFLKRLKDSRKKVLGICHETREKVKSMVPENLDLGMIERDLKRKNEDLEKGIEGAISMLMRKR
ncbi:hypothetical protein BDD12DRAFT_907174 [Trichophaea hybrida]|nr:hypothetical protein BDD12DRAFT_907174 [Trichophaea hybrida]